MNLPWTPSVYLGIDLGTKTVRTALVRRKGPELVCTRLAKIPRSELPEGRSKQFAQALHSRMQELHLPAGNVALSLPVDLSMLRYSKVPPAPPWRVELLSEYEVEEMASRSGEQLCFGWRKQSVGGQGPESPLLLVLGKEKAINDLLLAFREGGFGIKTVVPYVEALLAAWRRFADSPPSEGLEALVEFGDSNTHVVVTYEGDLIYARQAAFGSRAFNEELAERVDGSEEELERLKHSSTGLDSDGSRLDFAPLMRGPAGSLANLIQSGLGAAKRELGDSSLPLRRLFISGEGAKLNGLDRYLARSLGTRVAPCRAGSGCEAEVTEVLAGGVGGFLPCMGLAAVAPEPGKILEVLPEAEKKRRSFRQEKVFLYGGVGALILFLLFQLVAGFSRGAVTKNRLQALRKQKSRLEGESARLEELKVRRDALERMHAALNVHVENNAFFGKLLYFLGDPGNRLASGIQLSSVRQWPGGKLYSPPSVEIEGFVDNRNQNAPEIIHELESKLRSKDFVATTRLERTEPEPERKALRFRMKVTAPQRNAGDA